MPVSEPERSPCPFCARPAAVEAFVCPHCRGHLAMDVVLTEAIRDERRRYQLARALSALGPPLPGLSTIKDALGADHGVLARGLSRGAAERLLATLRTEHGIEAVAHQAAAQVDRAGVGQPPALPPPGRARRPGRTAGLALAGFAVVATIGIVAVRAVATRLSGSSTQPLSPRALQAIADQVVRSRGMVTGKGIPGGFGVFVTPELILARTATRGAETTTVTYADERRGSGTVVQADPDLNLVLVNVPGAGAEPLPLADATAIRDGDVLIVVERRNGRAIGSNATVTNAAVTRDGMSAIQLEAVVDVDVPGVPVVDRRGRVVGLVAGADRAAKVVWVLPVNYAFDWLAAPPYDKAAWERRTADPRRALADRDESFAAALEGPVLLKARQGEVVLGPGQEIVSERFVLLVIAPAAHKPSRLRVRIGTCEVDATVTWFGGRPKALAAFDRWAEAQGVRDLIATGQANPTLDRRNCQTSGARDVALITGGEVAAPVPLDE
jgi:hypothetical protein